MNAWVVPTARAVGWLPLLAVGGLLVCLSAVTAYADRWPVGMVGIAAGAVAAAAAAGLHDPAADLLSAMPTSTWTRLHHRLVLLVPAAVATWLAYLWPAPGGAGWPVAPMLALLATGVAVTAWLRGGRGVGAGIAVPLAWAAVGRVADGTTHEIWDVLLAWQHHPWLVTVAAVAAVLWGRNR